MARLLFALTVGVSGVLVATASPSERAERGFSFRTAVLKDVESLDPARVSLGDVWTYRLQQEIALATCSTLYAFRSSAKRVTLPVPEAADGPPQISRDGRRYTIVVRRGLRFSDGTPIDARSFARAIERLRSGDVVERMHQIDGISAVRARGRTLTITLRAASGDLPARLGTALFCPVPPSTPLVPVDAVPASGPYLIAERIPNERIVLRRNPRYRGSRPRRPRVIVITIGGTAVSNLRAVQAGALDLFSDEFDADELKEVGLSFEQLYHNPAQGTSYLALNNERPLFRDNVRLRRAVNLALDRRVAMRGINRFVNPTDQLIAPAAPGFVDAKIYRGRAADLARAKQLATGNLRGGHAVMYVGPDGLKMGFPQLVRASLAKIGLDVEFKTYVRAVIDARIRTPGEPWDIALTGRQTRPDDLRTADPMWFLRAVHGAFKPPFGHNNSWFDEPWVNRRLNAANRLVGQKRLRAFGRLDAEIMREYAPVAPVFNQPMQISVGRRLGCLRFVLEVLDYGALCTKS